MKVLEFKKKSELPKDILYRIDTTAESYVNILYESMLRLGGIQPDQEDFDRIHKMVIDAFEESLDNMVKKL